MSKRLAIRDDQGNLRRLARDGKPLTDSCDCCGGGGVVPVDGCCANFTPGTRLFHFPDPDPITGVSPGQRLTVTTTVQFFYSWEDLTGLVVGERSSEYSGTVTCTQDIDSFTLGSGCWNLGGRFNDQENAGSIAGSCSRVSSVNAGNPPPVCQNAPPPNSYVTVSSNASITSGSGTSRIAVPRSRDPLQASAELIGSVNFSGEQPVAPNDIACGAPSTIPWGGGAGARVFVQTRQDGTRTAFVEAFGPVGNARATFCGQYQGRYDLSQGSVTGGYNFDELVPNLSHIRLNYQVTVSWAPTVLPVQCDDIPPPPVTDVDCDIDDPISPCTDDNGQPLPPCCCFGTCSGPICNEIVEPSNCCPTNSGVFFDDTAQVDFLTSWSFRRDLCAGTQEFYEGFAIRTKPVVPGSTVCAQREAAMTLADPGSTRQSIHFLNGAPTEIVNVPFFLTARLGEDPLRSVQFRLRNRANSDNAININIGIFTSPNPVFPAFQTSGVPLPSLAGGQKYLPGPGFLLGMTFVYIWDQPILTCPGGGQRWTGELVLSVIGRREGYCNLAPDLPPPVSPDEQVRVAEGLSPMMLSAVNSAIVQQHRHARFRNLSVVRGGGCSNCGNGTNTGGITL